MGKQFRWKVGKSLHIVHLKFIIFFLLKVNNGASQNPCSETYAGPEPFSEPETAALRDFLAPIGRQINVYLSFHSYGQV